MVRKCLVVLCVSLVSAVSFAAHTGMGGNYAAGQWTGDWNTVVGADVVTQNMGDIGTVGAQYDGRTIDPSVWGTIGMAVQYRFAVDSTNLYVQVWETVADGATHDVVEGVSNEAQLYNKDTFALFFNDRTDTGTFRDLAIGFASSGQTGLAYGRDEAWANVSTGVQYAGTIVGGMRISEASVPLSLLDVTAGGVLRADGLIIDPWDDVAELPFYNPPAYNWQAQSSQGGGLWSVGADPTNYTYITGIPEPATMLLLGLGGFLVRRKR